MWGRGETELMFSFLSKNVGWRWQTFSLLLMSSLLLRLPVNINMENGSLTISCQFKISLVILTQENYVLLNASENSVMK